MCSTTNGGRARLEERCSTQHGAELGRIAHYTWTMHNVQFVGCWRRVMVVRESYYFPERQRGYDGADMMTARNALLRRVVTSKPVRQK
jgi:hypothetical protein